MVAAVFPNFSPEKFTWKEIDKMCACWLGVGSGLFDRIFEHNEWLVTVCGHGSHRCQIFTCQFFDVFCRCCGSLFRTERKKRGDCIPGPIIEHVNRMNLLD